MTYHVHAVEQDLAGKWYARVVITEDEAVFLKFPGFPSMADIQDAAIQYVESLAPPTEEPTGMIRTRNEEGQFTADDPATPDIDEAWVNAPTE